MRIWSVSTLAWQRPDARFPGVSTWRHSPWSGLVFAGRPAFIMIPWRVQSRGRNPQSDRRSRAAVLEHGAVELVFGHALQRAAQDSHHSVTVAAGDGGLKLPVHEG